MCASTSVWPVTPYRCPAIPQPVTGDDAALLALLDLAGLVHLAPRLDETDQWSHILSLGEQQRIAFIRALLVRPALLFLDEASSAMDEGLEHAMYRLLRDELPEAVLISVGHRSSLKRFHGRHVRIDGGRLQEQPVS